MLEQMRKNSQHPIVKGLFFLLAITFVVWGVGDVFRNNSDSGYAATIGKIGITTAELENTVRSDVARYQEMLGKTLSEDEIEKSGIKKYALNQLIRSKITAIRAEDLGLLAGRKMIAKYINDNDIFFNEQGKFDKEKFKAILYQNGMTEAKYINAIKREAAVNTLITTMTGQAVVPNIMANEVFRYNNENRLADIIIMPANLSLQVPEPSETDLVQFYNDNQDAFAVPEQRAITYVTFNLDKIKNNIKLSDEELKLEYERSLQQYKTEESRNVQQYLFKQEADALAALEQIKNGNIKAYTANRSDLGDVTKLTAPTEVRDVIFSLQKGEISKPVKTSFGWHIIIVKAITPEKVKSFDEVKNDIAKEKIAALAADEFSKFGNQVEDEFAAGKSMEEIASKFDLTIQKIPAVDSNGNAANGNKLKNIPDPAIFLPLAFNVDSGAHSALTLLSDNASYVIVRVDSIIVKRTKALDEIKGNAIKMWQSQEKEKLLQAKATEIAAKIKAGEDVKTLINKYSLKYNALETIKRPQQNAPQNGKNNVPIMLARELFSLKNIGDVTGAYMNDNGSFVIAKLKDIVKAEPVKDKNAYKELLYQLEDEMRDDIMSQYISYLQNQYPVSIKQ